MRERAPFVLGKSQSSCLLRRLSYEESYGVAASIPGQHGENTLADDIRPILSHQQACRTSRLQLDS